MRSLLGRFHRPMSRGAMGDMLTMNSLGDGSTLSLDFTTGVLDSRLTFTRSTTATYINSSGYVTSAAINAPRFDYSPTNIGEPRGLLIEGQAVNYLPNSVSLSGGSWFSGGLITKTTAYATGPDGVALSATRLQMSYSGGTGRIYYDASASYTTKPYTTSVWLKSNTGSNQTLGLLNSSGAVINLTVTPQWQRFETINTTGTTLLGYFYLENSSTNPAVVADVLVWGAQLEAGSGASSYIPTGASGVTRNADSCLMSGTNFSDWFTTAGTLLIEHQLTNAFGSNDRAQFSLGQYSPGIVAFGFFRTNATTVGAAVWGSGGTGYQEGTSVVSARTPIRSGMTLDFTGATRSLRAFANGTAGASLISTTGTISVDRMFIGSNGSGTSSTRDYQNGHIRSLKFWPSVLPNDQLQTLTAP